MEQTTDVTPASSPAIAEPRVHEPAAPAAARPGNGETSLTPKHGTPAYDHWRKTGELPSSTKTSKAASTPADSAPGDEPGDSDAPASEAGNQTQSRRRSNADTRLNEILADLKRAGLTPAELKTFQRAAAQQTSTEAAPAAPEQTAKPVEPPKPAGYDQPKPKLEDFDSLEEHVEALTDWKLAKAKWEGERAAAQEKLEREANEMLDGAKQRYGAEAETHIRAAASAVFQDAQVPGVIKAMLNDSNVMADVLYTLGSKSEVAAFVALAKAKPGEAIRKLVVIEGLIQAELKGGRAAGEGASEEAPPTERDSSGKFVSAKKSTEAPPPPRSAGGRTAPPPDPSRDAIERNDFRAFKEAENARDLARRRA